MAEPKIVGIHGGKTVSGAGVKPLPKQLINVRDNFRLKLQGSLRRLFDGADDALFEMIDKASTSEEQELYFDAMRELRLQKRQIATTVVKNLLIGFNTIQGTPKSKKEPEKHLESLDLVEKDELEVKVAIEAMINRVNSDSGADLQELCARVAKISENSEIGLNAFPASPYRLCQSFSDASEGLDFGIRAKLIVLKLFQRYVLSSLPDAYKEINALLRQAGVLPNLSLGKKVESKPKDVPSGAEASISPASPDARVPVLNEGQYVSQGLPFNELCSLLHNGQESREAPVASAIPQSNVIQLLSYNQHALSDIQPSSNECERVDFKSLVLDSPKTPKEGKLSHADSDTISLISMLFDFILDDRQLQPVMKALISRLQIPILKVAMLDRSFFDRGGHPARKLLNEMASAALGWTEGKEGKSDRLKAKIEELVSKVLNDFDQDISIFKSLLDDFTKFLFVENKRGKLIEQRTRDAENGKAAFDVAKKEVSNAIDSILIDKKSRGLNIPASVENFLSTAWGSVLNYTYLNSGPNSDAWRNQVRLVKDLVWTVCPENKDKDVRGKLIKDIPGVMRQCHIGLKLISFDEFKAKALLAEIQATHVEVLNKLQTYDEFEKPSIENEAVSELIQDTLEIEKEFNHLASIRNNKAQNSVATSSDIVPEENILVEAVPSEPNPELLGFLKQIDGLSIGTWFELVQNESKERCKLAAHIKAIDKYIFVNRSGIKVLEQDKVAFASLLQSGEIMILSDSLLFDRALESVIGSLRGVN